MQNTRELAPVAQAGGRVSTVQWLRRNQNGKERHGIVARGSKHWVSGLLLALSVSLSFSLSLSLSLHSLSLPQVADLNSVRVAPLKLSCCSAAEAHHGLWYVVLLNLAPLAVKTLSAQSPP